MDDIELDRGKTLQYLWHYCGHSNRPTGQTDSAHAEQVAERAVLLGGRYYREGRGFISPMDKTFLEALWHAGVLHEILFRSDRTFDDLAHFANLAVATMVAAVTRDKRQPITRRNMLFRGQIAEADILSQILCLADIECNLKQGLDLYKQDPKSARLTLSVWLDGVRDELTALHALYDFTGQHPDGDGASPGFRKLLRRGHRVVDYLQNEFAQAMAATKFMKAEAAAALKQVALV